MAAELASPFDDDDTSTAYTRALDASWLPFVRGPLSFGVGVSLKVRRDGEIDTKYYKGAC